MCGESGRFALASALDMGLAVVLRNLAKIWNHSEKCVAVLAPMPRCVKALIPRSLSGPLHAIKRGHVRTVEELQPVGAEGRRVDRPGIQKQHVVELGPMVEVGRTPLRKGFVRDEPIIQRLPEGSRWII